MKKKKKLCVVYVFICALFIGSVCILYKGIFEDIIPHSRQVFGNHEAFIKQAAPTCFQKELPMSAHDMKYYVYEGMFKDKSGYYAKFSAEDYEIVKQERFECYLDKEDIGGGYRYKDGSKEYVSLEQMKEKRIDFLDKLVSEKSITQYYFLCTYFYENSDIYIYQGVLCNDENCEVIEYEFYGPA